MNIIIMGAALGLLALASLQSVAQERKFSGGCQTVCLTESLLDQLSSVAIDCDEYAMSYRLCNGYDNLQEIIPVWHVTHEK